MGVGEEVKPHNWYKKHVERNPSSLESLIGDLMLFMMVDREDNGNKYDSVLRYFVETVQSITFRVLTVEREREEEV
jgi:hypothetical protein